MKLRVLSREIFTTLVSQRALSIVILLLVGGMCSVVLATSGKAYAARDAVNSSIDDTGFRAVVIEADGAAGLDTSLLESLSSAENIDWLIGFGDSVDVHNAATAGDNRVGLRTAYVQDPQDPQDPSVLGTHFMFSEGAYVSPAAQRELGLEHPAGALETEQGLYIDVLGSFTVPDQLSYLDPVAIMPMDRTGIESLTSIVAVVDRAENVNAVIGLARSLLSHLPPDSITIRASQDLANLQETVETQLAGSAQTLTALVFGAVAVLVAITLFGFSTLRRKDYGRRRALGASIWLLIEIQLGYVTLLSALGAILGITITTVTMITLGVPVPELPFLTALAWNAVIVAAAASVAPALYASRRDPAKELRIP